MGRVKTSIVEPLGQPVNSRVMIADSETPPGAMLNGARNRSKLAARITEPIVNKKYSGNILLRSRDVIFFPISLQITIIAFSYDEVLAKETLRC